MNYQTKFTVNYKNDDHEDHSMEIFNALKDLNPDCFNNNEAINLEAMFKEPLDWYSWNENMTALSKLFPLTTFVIYGNGQDYGDCWKAYFRNGDIDYCKSHIVYDSPQTTFGKLANKEGL